MTDTAEALIVSIDACSPRLSFVKSSLKHGLGKVTINAIRGAAVFFDLPMTATDLQPQQSPEFQHQLRALEAVAVDSRLNAQVIVVDDPVQLGLRTSWISSLLGQTVVSRAMFLNGVGSAVRFQPAIRTARKIYMTAEFVSRHGTVVRILQACSRSSGSQWRLLDSRHRQCIVLVPDSADTADRKSGRQEYGPAPFLQFVTHVAASTAGVVAL